jgi:hypothetical protein
VATRASLATGSARGERATARDPFAASVRPLLCDLGFVRDAEVVAILGKTGFDQDAPGDVDWSPADVVQLSFPNVFDYEQRSVELRTSGTVPGPLSFGEIARPASRCSTSVWLSDEPTRR